MNAFRDDLIDLKDVQQLLALSSVLEIVKVLETDRNTMSVVEYHLQHLAYGNFAINPAFKNKKGRLMGIVKIVNMGSVYQPKKEHSLCGLT